MTGGSFAEDFGNWKHGTAFVATLALASVIGMIVIILLEDYIWLTLTTCGSTIAYLLQGLISDSRNVKRCVKCGKLLGKNDLQEKRCDTYHVNIKDKTAKIGYWHDICYWDATRDAVLP